MEPPVQTRNPLRLLEEHLLSPELEDVQRARFRTALFSELIGVLLILVWTVVNFAVGFRQLALLNIVTAVLIAANFLFLSFNKNARLHLHITLGILASQLIGVHILLGGFSKSGFVAVWWFAPVLIAIFTFGFWDAVPWFIVLSGLLILGAWAEPSLSGSVEAGNPGFILFAAVFNLILIGSFVTAVVHVLLTRLERERRRAERLLLNILPAAIASRLKQQPGTIAERHESASILFADIVGFTPRTAGMEAGVLIEFLNSIYSHLDGLVEKHGLEKIRTIGDNYMVASGVPEPRPDHAHALARFGLDILEFSRTSSDVDGLQFRIGINTGPVVAGVIGDKKFHYDVWGDAVNTASRMESHGLPGRIQVTRATYELLKDDFQFDSRGKIEVKGVGEMETWFLRTW